MLASARALNSTNNSIKSPHDREGARISTSSQRRRIKQTGELNELQAGIKRNRLQLNNESESFNTSSASSSGYTSHNGAHLQHNIDGQANSSQSYHKPQFYAHQPMMSDQVSPRMMVNKIGNGLRQLSANGHYLNQRHPHQQLQYHQRSCSQVPMSQSSMVPMMIDDEDDQLDVDGQDLIDDDIELASQEADDSNGLIGANGHDNNNNNNNNESNTISAFDPQILYAFRGTQRNDRRRPLVDCVDSSSPMRSADGRGFHPSRYPQFLKQVQQQNADTNNNRLALQSQQHHVMANTRPHEPQSIQTDAQSGLLVYNPYEIGNGKQANSLVYQQSNSSDSNQFQQQYHSFSYHQPVQQLQLASSNQQLQYPAYYHHQQHLATAGAAHADSVLGDRSGNSSSGSVVDTSVRVHPVPSRKQVAPKQRVASKKNKEISRMQTGSRQHLSSPADQHQHHSNRNKSATTSRKELSTSRSNNQMATPKDQSKALGCCGKMAKLLLFITNILFWSAGVALVAWGIYSLTDDHKYNLSQLLIFEPSNKMSLFQLLSWSFITLGCAAVLVGFCGCSAILKNNRWILGLYIFLILAIFALDLATGLLAIIFQEKLVANVRLRLINKLRSEYGVQASFTAAIDYIQTKFECCGLEGHFDYDQSLWRLQRLGGFEATVARTCCHLRNAFDDQAHINPRPVNESMCQSTDVRFHQSYRYRKGCLDDLERMVRQKIWTFTIGCGAVGGVILLSLLFATCFCRSIPSHSLRKSSVSNQQQPSSNHHHHDKTPKQASGLTLAQQMDAQQQRHYR